MKSLFITKPFVIEPLGLMYLSAVAKQAGHRAELALTTEDLEKKLADYNPDIVAYSIMTGDQNFYFSLNNRLKQNFRFFSVFGGPHPTFFPAMIGEKGVDAVCVGEGEQAFVELLDSLEDNRDIRKIKNFHIKKNGEITCNDVRAFADVDSLPFPDRQLVARFPEIREGPIKHFIASRGCPFNCSYCFNEQYSKIYSGKGRRVRFRDVDSLIEEVYQTTSASPTRFVYFQDDTFTLSKDWLAEFSEKYAERIKLPFHCHVRANTLDENRTLLLKNAGCYSVHIATETANDRIRNEILSRNMSREQIINAAGLLKKHRIKFMMQNILGLPTGELKDDIATLELNIECQPDYAWASIFQPYPGTRLGSVCKEHGFYTGDFSDIESSFFDSSRLNFSEEYKNQLSNLQKLFAILVEYSELHRLGLSDSMINAPATAQVKETYKKAYSEFRKKADERLYGFKL